VAPLPRVEPALVVRTHGVAADAGAAPERWQEIGPATVDRDARLPVGRGHSGPSTLRVQVLLNRAFFSPGMLDGRWGRNTQNAVLWFQGREGLPTTGVVDPTTYAALERVGGADSTSVEVVLTAADVRGPFVQIPSDIYEQAKLRCSCFESLAEKLSERFHSRVELLQRLNPGVRLDSLEAGASLRVPRVRAADARAAGEVRQLVVSGTGNYLQALDGEGRILYHFAATLGAAMDPSPEGEFIVRSIHPNPWWHYQPRILAHVDDDLPSALIPPGPNSSVGTVWMSLSVPRYGIHGTRSPETIGYAESAGCVRLTNWDVVFLSHRVVPGTRVEFRDTRPAPAAPKPIPPASSPAAGDPAAIPPVAPAAPPPPR
jgi:lipoprotein-anchoring transpeptidase ErfK/SrfK